MPCKRRGSYTVAHVKARLLNKDLYDVAIKLPTNRSFQFREFDFTNNKKLASNLHSMGCIRRIGKSYDEISIWETTEVFDKFLVKEGIK